MHDYLGSKILFTRTSDTPPAGCACRLGSRMTAGAHGCFLAVNSTIRLDNPAVSGGDNRFVITAATNVVRSDDKAAKLRISRNDSLPSSGVDAFFKNPFADLEASGKADLKIENALITPVPNTSYGWVIAICIFVFIAFYAIGPGVCVWLALSELMPTRIRSNGMSIALLVNQAVSTTIAAIFLPTVGKYGYSTMFFSFAGCTVIHFITASFFLQETKGKTLEEIEEYFEETKQ